MPFIDFKITAWERMNVNDDDYKIIKEKFESGEFTTMSDVYRMIDDFDIERIDDTEEILTPLNNSGCSTIELFANKCEESEWENGE